MKVTGRGDAPTIQAAIDLAASGDTVLVWPGTYYESINFRGKGIVLESLAGPQATILDGSQVDDSILVLVNEEPPGTTVRGFTLRNGRGHLLGADRVGGVIYIAGGAHVLVETNIFEQNTARWGAVLAAWPGYVTSEPVDRPELVLRANVFQNNYADSGGGVLHVTNVLAEIVGNRFVSNSARNDGGAIYAIGWVSHLRIVGNEFRDNEGGDKGGAIWAHSYAGVNSCLIENNLFVKNKASGKDWKDIGTGGAMAIGLEGGGVIRNNTIVLNEGRGDTQCSGGGIAFHYAVSNLTVTHNVIAYNTGCAFSCWNLQSPETILMGPNLVWKNGPKDIGQILDECPDWESSVIENDPRFCDLKGGIYTVEANSPALTNPLGIFGMDGSPGCGSIVPIEATTWGEIKALYYDEP